MIFTVRFFAALCLILGLQVLALNITSPVENALWHKGQRETVAWEDGPEGKLTFQLQILNKAQFIWYDIHSDYFDAGEGRFTYRPTSTDVKWSDWAGTYLRVIDESGTQIAKSERFDIKV